MARNFNRLLRYDFLNACIFKSKFSQQILYEIKLFSATPPSVVKKIEGVIPVYKKMDHEYKITKKATVQALEEILYLRKFDALDIVINNPYFRQVSKATMKKNYSLCVQNGIIHETLVKYPEILTMDNLEVKLNEIQKLSVNPNDGIILATLSLNHLRKFIPGELNEKTSKIAIMSSLLEISKQRVCECIAQKPFLISCPPERIAKNIELLRSYKIPPKDIINDLWVLKYSETLISSRLDIAKEHKIKILKTWMIRVQIETFQTHIQRHSETLSILGDHSLAEYLSKRLECNVAMANYLIMKQPTLKNRSMKKLKELIDLLYAEGFKSYHICRVPKILVHSVETTKKRLKQLEEKGIKIDSLSILTKSQNQFMQYYEALVKSKNKAKI